MSKDELIEELKQENENIRNELTRKKINLSLWQDTAMDIKRQLEQYKATGLTPEEIKDHEEMFKAYRHVCGGMSPEEVKNRIEFTEALVDAWEGNAIKAQEIIKRLFKLLKGGTSEIRGSHAIDTNNPLTAPILSTMVEAGREALKGGVSE